MPYKSADDLPDSVKKALPKEARDIFYRAFNSAYNEYGEERSFKIAWTAVQNAGYHKNEKGEWVKAWNAVKQAGYEKNAEDKWVKTGVLSRVEAKFTFDKNGELAGKIWGEGIYNLYLDGVPTALHIPPETVEATYKMLKEDVDKGIITLGLDHAGSPREIAYDVGEVDEVGITDDKKEIYMKRAHFYPSETKLISMLAGGIFYRSGYGYSIVGNAKTNIDEKGNTILEGLRISRVDIVKGQSCPDCFVTSTGACPSNLTASGVNGVEGKKESVSVSGDKTIEQRLEQMGETLKAKNALLDKMEADLKALQAKLAEREACASKAAERIKEMEQKMLQKDAEADIEVLASQGKVTNPEMREALLKARLTLPADDWKKLSAGLTTVIPQGEKGVKGAGSDANARPYDTLPAEVKAVAGIPEKKGK